MKSKPPKKGSPRMVELGKLKVEVWMTKAQHAELKKLAQQLGMPLATLARRACNYVARGGVNAAHPLRNGYD